ncbi:hypothetical protein GZH47_23270 [Paenibacillus rhizovicinus]|uniref:Uncharacterized protein n=1 Tax=Paenibacillus rhizovicinus TaxID=2704463 RepID=A0A6C0P4P7_9BACL|nr:hypothetical protein [Paenibacillus rhizovicinus]QHW33425.1 hypothetical protein GZH47_23270 [Paenibacillus rhizovicinus]
MNLLNNRRFRLLLLLPIFVLLGLALASGIHSGHDGSKPPAKPLPDADTIFLEGAAKAREIAWNRLPAAEQRTIIGNWKEAKVANMPITASRKAMKSTGDARPVFQVTFPTTADALLGPIVMYFDQATFEYLGSDIRE